MEKSLLRAFLFSLIVFFALNFLIYIVIHAIGGILDVVFDHIITHPTNIIYSMIYPSEFFVWELLDYFMIAISLHFKIFYLGGFISYIIAAIIAGLMGGSIAKSFGGWILMTIFSMILFITIVSIDPFNLDYISYSITLIEGIVIILITGIINALIFGALTIIIALVKGRS